MDFYEGIWKTMGESGRSIVGFGRNMVELGENCDGGKAKCVS